MDNVNFILCFCPDTFRGSFAVALAGVRPDDEDTEDRTRESLSGGLLRSLGGKGFVGECFDDNAAFFSRSFVLSISGFLLLGGDGLFVPGNRALGLS